MSNDRIQGALEELRKQRHRVESLRKDYRVLSRSRFYALRMLWLAAKAMVGGAAVRDTFVTAAAVGLHEAVPHEEAREVFDAEEIAALWRDRVSYRTDGEIAASVIIPVFNHLNDTLRCLRSIAQTWPASLSAQVIIVDDASTDGSGEVLSTMPGVVYLRNSENLGFIQACNAGAEYATGKYLCFLNNDTVVRNAWLDYLVSTAERDPRIGAVGAKLIYPNGTLQEAGGIIWRDGHGWNYGRGGDPNDSRYNYEREVDYCSGAALLVRRDAFVAIGGFSTALAPAYYEDADLCFALRDLGLRVVYQPRAEVVHYEGVSSGTDLNFGVKRYQAINREKFAAKWQAALDRHYENNSVNVPMAARRHSAKPSVLVVDSYVPLHDKEAGSNRLMHIIRIMRDAGFAVRFLPDNYAALQPYTDELQSLGVEVLYHSEKGPPMDAALHEVLTSTEYMWICRPELYEKYAPAARRHSGVKVIYDTIDLHFIRKQREYDVLGKGNGEASKYERAEISAAQTADATVVVSDVECSILRERGIYNVHVVPTIHDCATSGPRTFRDSSGVLFIGNYNHSPNVDAAEWLVNEIMPLVWKRLPRTTLTLLGSNPTSAIRALESRRVHVPGYVENVEPYFTKARVFAAPLRYGAGLKGKVGQAMAFGLPMVLSDVAAEGFGLLNEHDCLIANGPQGIADAIIGLHEDKLLWSRLSANAMDALRPFGSDAVRLNLLRLFDSLSGARV